jgi:predicted transcriptional regulator
VEKIQLFPTVCQNPNWTFWHQLKRFFAHYERDADAPMRCNSRELTFWFPPVLHPSVKRILLISPTLSEQHLRKVFPDEEIEFIHTEPSAWLANNHVFQIRTGVHPSQKILNYESNWDTMGLTKLGERFFVGIRNEIEKDSKTTHAIITYKGIPKHLSDLAEKENVCFVKNFKDTFSLETTFEAPQVLWIVGVPHWPQLTIWRQAQMLFGNDDKPLYYDEKIDPHHYEDERIQEVYQQSVAGLLTQIVGGAGLSRWTNKKIVLLTSMPLPDITDRPETHLFDWEDFQIAGGLDKLPEVIATREKFEADYANLTGESSREEVERILGCSTRTANRQLQKLRGGNIQRISIREQILFLLATGEKKTSLLVEAIDSSAQTIGNELKKLLDEGEIVRVRRGVYKLPD